MVRSIERIIRIFFQIEIRRTRKNKVSRIFSNMFSNILSIITNIRSIDFQFISPHLVQVFLFLTKFNPTKTTPERTSNTAKNRIPRKRINTNSFLWTKPTKRNLTKNRVKNRNALRHRLTLLFKFFRRERRNIFGKICKFSLLSNIPILTI